MMDQITQLLNQTFNPNHTLVTSATESLDRLSLHPDFPYALLSICSGGDNQGQRIAAATYLKNFTRRNADVAKVSVEFKNRLVHASLLAEPAVLKVLVEAFRSIVVKEFVKENSWPELVPELRNVIQNSNFISGNVDSQWKTVNALTVLQSILRPFQYFLNPNIPKEPVPPQLDLIAQDILVPLLAVFHNHVEKALSTRGRAELEPEKILLLVCKCIYFTVRSYMPSALVPSLPLFCQDLFRILDSLSFDTTTEDDLLRFKTGKRSLLIFCALVTRHRKHSDKLMPNIINCTSSIVMQNIDISKLDFLSERVFSLAFDVISHVLETGPGWRLVSPHFSSLMDAAIFPALVMNDKDILEWEEDPDEYIRKNLPSDIEEVSGWREDLFTGRKSATNLLGVISFSKGPPMSCNNNSASSVKRKKGDKIKGKERSSIGELLVLPYLSKFPVPTDATVGQSKISKDYYGVLMAFGSLQDFLMERNPGYIATLVQTRVLPLYSLSTCLPYLVAAANWVLGELASCHPEEISANIYSSLLKALVMPDMGDISCYPVRASAAGAIIELLENDYLPPEWPPLLQVVISRTDNEDDNESSILFQLLSTIVQAGNDNVIVHIPYIISAMVGVISKRIPPIPEPWPQVVERGFSALATMTQTWEGSAPEEDEENEARVTGSSTIARACSALLRQAWLRPEQATEGDISDGLHPASCLNDASILLQSIMQFVTEAKEVSEMKLSELLTVWASLIADWHAWEELEDLSIFDCIKEVVHLCRKCALENFFVTRIPSPPAPPIPQCSIIEGIGAFVTEAITQYPSATWRACSCVHLLLHIPNISLETEVQQSLVVAFSGAALSRFREIQSKPSALWKPLLLVISSCYLCNPDIVEEVLEKDEKGFTAWASALSYISTSSFEPGISAESEIKLIVMALVKLVERLLGTNGDPGSGLVRDCFISLMEAVIRLKEIEGEEDDDDEEADDDEEDDETDDDDDEEDSEDDEREETEEEFLDRYAKVSMSLENGIDVEEGDVEDQDQELELGTFGEVDQQRAALSLIERYNQIFVRGEALPPQLLTGFVNTFPEYDSLFLHS